MSRYDTRSARFREEIPWGPGGESAILAGVNTTLKPLRIGSLTIEFPVVLAALAGFSDLSYRLICRSAGAPAGTSASTSALKPSIKAPRSSWPEKVAPLVHVVCW